MNPDIWPTAVDHFYFLASNGRWVDGVIGWTLRDRETTTFHNAQGRLEAYGDGEGLVGLRGALNTQPPNYPGVFQPMELTIESPRGGRTTVTVTNTASGRRVDTDDAFAGYPWHGNTGISWIFQAWNGQDYVDVYLIDHFANAISQPVSSVIENVLGLAGTSILGAARAFPRLPRG
jgi:hypothetical protein